MMATTYRDQTPAHDWDAEELQAIADELGITPQGVRWISRQALAKLRTWCDEHGLSVEDLPS